VGCDRRRRDAGGDLISPADQLHSDHLEMQYVRVQRCSGSIAAGSYDGQLATSGITPCDSRGSGAKMRQEVDGRAGVLGSDQSAPMRLPVR